MEILKSLGIALICVAFLYAWTWLIMKIVRHHEVDTQNPERHDFTVEQFIDEQLKKLAQ